MPDLRQLLEHTGARERLRSISGVRRIGFGLKEKGGEVLPEYVFRVYVRRKQALSALRPEEVIPAEIDGIKTDVLVLLDSEPSCKTKVAPGMQITRDVPTYGESPGTLGCVVKKAQPSSKYILTAQHVVVPKIQDFNNISKDVFQPKRSYKCEIEWTPKVATVVNENAPWSVQERRDIEGKKYWLDCGLLQINPDVLSSNTIDGIGALHAQLRDLATEPSIPVAPAGIKAPASTITLHKRGAVTGVTHGTVVELCHEEIIEGSSKPVDVWELAIRPTGGYQYSKTYRISADEPTSMTDILNTFAGQPVMATRLNPGDASDRRIHFEGSVFSLEGDSGAICVDDSQHASGLLVGGRGLLNVRVEGEDKPVFIPSGVGEACHIRPVFIALGLDPDTAIVVDSSPTSGPIMIRPGDELAAGVEAGGDLAEAIARFELTLHATSGGRRLLDLFREHHREVIDLVNRRRRVTLAWQRGKGPAFMAAFLDAIRSGGGGVLNQVAGHSIEDLVEQMLSGIEQEGSARLRQATATERAFVSQVVRRCDSFDQLFAFLAQDGLSGTEMRR
jgi:hypothetical protein